MNLVLSASAMAIVSTASLYFFTGNFVVSFWFGMGWGASVLWSLGYQFTRKVD